MHLTGLHGNAIINLEGGTYSNNAGGTTTLTGTATAFGEIINFSSYINETGATTTN